MRWTTRVLGVVAAIGAMIASGCAGGGANAPAKPSGVNGQFAFWPQFPSDPRVQFVRAIGGSEDVAPSTSSRFENIVFGEEKEKSASITKPYGLAMRDGRIYVCDMRGGALVVLDLLKKQTRLVGVTGANRLSHPVAVALAEDGAIYVAESDRGAILAFDASERFSHAIGFQKFKPVSLAVHGQRLYACDMLGQSVQVFDRASGKHLATIGKVGDGDGEFRLPIGVACDPAGNVYVVDMMRARVQKFAPDGSYLSGVGALGDTAGSFARPKHIAVDRDGIVYVVDASFQNVQMFDDKLRLLLAIGAAGNFPGSMNMPAGVCVDDASVAYVDDIHPGFAPKRVIAVTNQFGPAKVNLYVLGEKREGYSAADFAKSAVKIATGVGATDETVQMQRVGLDAEPAPDPVQTPAPETTISPK